MLSSLILCGGKGSRLGRLGKKIPKTLLKIKNKSIIDHLIINLKKNDIKKITLSTFYKHNLINNYIKQKKNYKNIEIYNDGDINILERIKLNLKRSNSDLLVLYGDEIARIDLKKLYKNHKNSKKKLTITTIKLKSNFGFLFRKNKKFIFKEKPFIGNYNIGYMIFDKKCINLIKNTKYIETFIQKLCDLNDVNQYVYKGVHTTVNTLEDYNKAKNIKI